MRCQSNLQRATCLAAAVLLNAGGLSSLSFANAPASRPNSPASARREAEPPALGSQVAAFAEQLRAEIGGERALDSIMSDAQTLWNFAIRYSDPKLDADGVVEACATWRLCTLLFDAGKGATPETFAAVRANPEAARALALALKPGDDRAKALKLFEQLATMYPKQVADEAGLGALVAATCVVFDQPPSRMPQTKQELGLWRMDRFRGKPADGAEVFGFFAKNRAKMMTPLEDMSPEALVWVVSTPCTVKELEWALREHRGHRTVGKLYERVRYDTAHFKFNQPKKITETTGYTLENIMRVGGVCAEQAYFAANVGRAIGVPATEVSVKGPDAAHAYVGYMRSIGGAQVWDFDEGRYDDYEKIRGEVIDPQTREIIGDGYVSLTAGLMADKRADREAAIALTDAAIALADARERARPKVKDNPRFTNDIVRPRGRRARGFNILSSEEMVKGAVEFSPHYAPAWEVAAKVCSSGKVEPAKVKEWGEAVLKVASSRRAPSPEFAFDTLALLFESVETPEEKDRMWEWASDRFKDRPDLAAAAEIERARVWSRAKQPGKAWKILENVIKRSRNEGTVIVDALAEAESLLRDEKKDAKLAIDIYEDALQRIAKPSKVSAEFARSSNHYRVGRRLADLYGQAGRTREAERMERLIEPDVGG